MPARIWLFRMYASIPPTLAYLKQWSGGEEEAAVMVAAYYDMHCD